MGMVILKRCCGNCEWSISPECEEEIMRENHYEEDDTTRPRIGDCCLSIDHEGKYVCREHEYNEDGINCYVFYDDTYLGEGFFIVAEYNNEIIKFLKVYRTGRYSSYCYNIRGYDAEPFTYDKIKQMKFDLSYFDDPHLIKAFSSFVEQMNNSIINSSNYRDKSNLSTELYNYDACLTLTKRVQSIENSDNFIDFCVINTFDNRSIYKAIAKLFRNLEVIYRNGINETTVKRIRKISK